MSKSWARGSTRRWRRTRAQVLARDNHTCQLRLDGCTVAATDAHHTRGKAFGDDPHHLVAACRHCNLKIGDPMTRRHDPQPTPRSNW